MFASMREIFLGLNVLTLFILSAYLPESALASRNLRTLLPASCPYLSFTVLNIVYGLEDFASLVCFALCFTPLEFQFS